MTPQRVVVTGLGAVSPLGNTAPAMWEQLLAGANGTGPITAFDASAYSTRIAAEVKDFEIAAQVERKDARRMARFTQFAINASLEALAHSGLSIDEHNAPEVGVSLGCGIGGMEIIEEQHHKLIEKGPKRVSPLMVPMFIPNMAAGQVAIYTGAKGPNVCPVTACASASHALGEAFKIIQRGDAQVMIAGGTEAAITPLSIAGFCSARTMSGRNESPELASRPFDVDRDGFVMGEGSGMLVLESLASAQARGATIYAEMLGYGMTADAYHITAPTPDGSGIARAMQLALKDAGLVPENIQYINAHGTSTPLNDKTETQAIVQVFGDHAHALKINSTKSMTGHLLGAAGGVEAVATVYSLYSQKLHPTRNLDNPDPECPLDYVPKMAQNHIFSHALSNNMGFGGHNVSLAFCRFSP